MSEVLKAHWTSWRSAHGFAILCIVNPEGEHFLIGPDHAQVAAGHAERDFASWIGVPAAQLAQTLANRGLSEADTDDAIRLSRKWATTITGAVFPWPSTSRPYQTTPGG